jgi:hypothetical protein
MYPEHVTYSRASFLAAVATRIPAITAAHGCIRGVRRERIHEQTFALVQHRLASDLREAL